MDVAGVRVKGCDRGTGEDDISVPIVVDVI